MRALALLACPARAGDYHVCEAPALRHASFPRRFAMFRALACLALLAVIIAGFPLSRAADPKPLPGGNIDRKDVAKMDAIFAKDAHIELLAEGFKWAEGPVWDKK